MVRRLRELGHTVIGLDLRASPFTEATGSIVDRNFVRAHTVGCEAIVHCATLHKPHVATHSNRQFVDTNVTGTLNLLEEAVSSGVRSFVFTSTTSVYARAIADCGNSAVPWVTEDFRRDPKNIYGVTKIAAENLCEFFHRRFSLPCIILRTSRFFPEEDDRKEIRDAYDDTNAKVNEFLYRRADIEDVVSAHLLALQKATVIGFAQYIISATTPFGAGDLAELRSNAPATVRSKFPHFDSVYSSRGWMMFPGLDRIYSNARARNELGWNPRNDFGTILERLKANEYPFSEMTRVIGSKGYHETKFAQGPFPVE